MPFNLPPSYQEQLEIVVIEDENQDTYDQKYIAAPSSKTVLKE